MTAIIDGQLVRGANAEKAMGGTELMALRMIKYFDPEKLKRVNIVHQRVDDSYLANGKPTILVLHDLPNDPSALHLKDEASRSRFVKICPVSDWQAQVYNIILGVPYRNMKVIRNFIEPFPTERPPMRESGPIKIIYHTTPHRGLELLVPIFLNLAQQHQDIELHIYSSFKIYGWDQRDEPYKKLFETAEKHPRIFNHGNVSNETIREVLPKMDIYAYPSIWPECCSLAMIEALASGTHVVTNNYASLPETTMGLAHMVDFTESHQEHANRFAAKLDSLIVKIKDEKQGHEMREQQIVQQLLCNDYYSVNRVLRKWNDLFDEILV